MKKVVLSLNVLNTSVVNLTFCFTGDYIMSILDAELQGGSLRIFDDKRQWHYLPGPGLNDFEIESVTPEYVKVKRKNTCIPQPQQ